MWCRKCQVLSYSAEGDQGDCAAGGKHDHTASLRCSLSTIPIPNGKSNWRWCNRCQALVYAFTDFCASGNNHDPTDSSDYAVYYAAASGQDGWRWCNKCQALFFAASSDMGDCPVAGKHQHDGSAHYKLFNGAMAQGQHGWLRCSKCQVLSYAKSKDLGDCAGGGKHHHDGSLEYSIEHGATPFSQRGWRWCKKCQILYYSAPPRCAATGSEHHFGGSGVFSLLLV